MKGHGPTMMDGNVLAGGSFAAGNDCIGATRRRDGVLAELSRNANGAHLVAHRSPMGVTPALCLKQQRLFCDGHSHQRCGTHDSWIFGDGVQTLGNKRLGPRQIRSVAGRLQPPDHPGRPDQNHAICAALMRAAVLRSLASEKPSTAQYILASSDRAGRSLRQRLASATRIA